MKNHAPFFDFVWSTSAKGVRILDEAAENSGLFEEATVSLNGRIRRKAAERDLYDDERVLFLVYEDFELGKNPEIDAKETNPLLCGTLHQDFIGLTQAEIEGFSKFAATWGMLGRETEYVTTVDGRRYLGEAIEFWIRASWELKAMHQVHDWIKDEDEYRLRRVIEIDEGECTFREKARFFSKEEIESSPTDCYDADFMLDASVYRRNADQLGTRRFIKLARELYHDQLNIWLREGSVPAVHLGEANPVTLVPQDLLGAIHCQFIMNKYGIFGSQARCLNCNSFYSQENSKRKYCSEQCKFKAYRKRVSGKKGS